MALKMSCDQPVVNPMSLKLPAKPKGGTPHAVLLVGATAAVDCVPRVSGRGCASSGPIQSPLRVNPLAPLLSIVNTFSSKSVMVRRPKPRTQKEEKGGN